jgi:uncharacterized protein with PQ loop repeat
MEPSVESDLVGETEVLRENVHHKSDGYAWDGTRQSRRESSDSLPELWHALLTYLLTYRPRILCNCVNMTFCLVIVFIIVFMEHSVYLILL